ncbi:MAG TPA: ChaN family lipoprotein, partial [Albitalea sp.]|nr:ChaN family lipoprotein [Albitalea sp.]
MNRIPFPSRRRVLIAAAGALAGCATPPAAPWEARLQRDALVLLGEVHDNPEQHRLRLAVLRRALRSGWRPAIAMEQFDTDRQADIDRARVERPGDAQHLIAQASAARGGWDWDHYRPIVALALEFDLPLRAANLPASVANRLVRGDYAAVLGEPRVRELGLMPPPDADWQAAQQREIVHRRLKRGGR